MLPSVRPQEDPDGMPSKDVDVDEHSVQGRNDVEISLEIADYNQDSMLQPAQQHDLSVKLIQRLHSAAEAIKMLKEYTMSALSERDETIKTLTSSSRHRLAEPPDHPAASNDASMKNIFDQVMEVLSPSAAPPLTRDASNRRFRTSPRGRTRPLADTGSGGLAAAVELGGGSSREPGRRRRSPSAGSRSVSPEGGGRARRRDVGRSEPPPAPAGGFRRLADMSSNAFLQAPAPAGPGAAAGRDGGGDDDDADREGATTKIKYPLVRCPPREHES
jgi:hypothetical protein